MFCAMPWRCNCSFWAKRRAACRKPVRVSAPDVPWAQIIATRNRIAHGYTGLNWIIVWDIATLELPKLAPHFDALLAKWSAP
jgi:uncharacterized protein with HEPN domain